jgi:hypothetical protein
MLDVKKGCKCEYIVNEKQKLALATLFECFDVNLFSIRCFG